MKKGILLYISAHELTAFRWRGRQLDRIGTYGNDASGHRQFAGDFSGSRKEPVTVLVNSPEESFANETIPNVRGRDRTTLIGHRVEQRFPQAQFTAALSLGRSHRADKRERLLLAALPRPEILSPWLRPIAAHGIVLDGIHSTSFLAPALIRLVRPDERNCLLLTLQDHSIRQAHINDGRLQFSRLTGLSDLSDGHIAEQFIDAATRLRLYLISQRLLDHGTPLKAYLVAPASIAAIIAAGIPKDGALDCVVIDVADCCQRAGIPAAPTAGQCETVFLALAASSPPRARYTDPSMRRALRSRNTRRALFGTGGITLALSLAIVATLHLHMRDLDAIAEQAQQESAQIRQRHDLLQRSLPTIPVAHEHLQSLIAHHHRLYQENTGPSAFFRTISHALAATPSIEIEHIDWALDKDPPAKATTSAPRMSGETAIISGHVLPLDDARLQAATTQLRRFVNALREAPQLHVRTSRLTADEVPAIATTAEDQAQHHQRPFVIELTRNREP